MASNALFAGEPPVGAEHHITTQQAARPVEMHRSTDAFAEASATDLAAAVRAKSISALELTDAAIARIEARDGPINAVV